MSERLEHKDGMGINFKNAAEEASLHNMSLEEFNDWLKQRNQKKDSKDVLTINSKKDSDKSELEKAA